MKKMRDLAAAKSINGGDNLLIARNDGWSVYSNSSRSVHYPTIYLSNSDSHVNKSFKLPPIRHPIHDFSKCLINYPTVMLIYDNFKSAVYYDCERDGGDKKWNKGSLVDKRWTENCGHYALLCDAIVFEGKFYGIDYVAEILEIAIQRGRQGGGMLTLLSQYRPNVPLPSIKIEKVQFVESRGQMFVVIMRTNLKIEIFQFQLSTRRFSHVYNLSDRVFLLSNNYSCSGSGEELGTGGNFIYFTQDNNETMHIFNLEDDTLSTTHTRDVSSLSFSYDGLLPVLRIRNCDNQIVGANGSKSTTAKTEEPEGLESMIMIKLPLHMQEHVAKYVKRGQDYLNFRLVCTRWRSITPTRQWQAAPCVSAKNGFDYPWLMSVNRATGTCKLSDPKENTSYFLSDPELLKCVIRCSKDGWLLVTKGLREVFLYEPFTKKKIQLPALQKNYFLNGICLSDSPTSSKLTVFGFSQLRDGTIHFMFLDIGDPTPTWSKITLEHTRKPFTASYSNPVFFKGLFYCLSQEGSIGVFNKTALTWNVICAPPTPLASLSLTTKIVSSFLIPYNEELFSVHVSNRAGELVRVFKLNCTCESGDEKWEEVSSLGNIALFISETASFALTVREERMKNSICFPCISCTSNNHVFYSLASGTFRTCGNDGGFTCTRTLYDSKEQLHSSWIEPRLVPSSW